MFSSHNLLHLPRTLSDHSPLLLTVGHNEVHHIFCFENHWLDYNDCLFTIRNALNFHAHSSPMHAFLHISNRVHLSLFAWKSKGFCNLDLDIRATEVSIHALELEGIDNSLDDNDSINFNVLYNKHKALLRQNAKKWSQRAKINWIQNGDLKTSYFHKCARVRKHFNYISHIVDNHGNIFTD